MPDPGLSAEDVQYDSDRGLLTARIHNVGSLPIRDVKVAFFEGDPASSEKQIGIQRIPNIEAPNDLEPRMVKVGINYRASQPTDIYVVIDPQSEIENEITTFNNSAHQRLTGADVNVEQPTAKPTAAPSSRGRGRGR